jgi:membrane fusion protein (multidrug efflux system)
LKFFQVRAAIAQASAFQPPPEAVTTIVAGSERWTETLAAIGSATAVQGVTVSADLPGVVEKIEFESGRTVRAGEVLVRLDASQERAQLAAAEAQRDLAKLEAARKSHLAKDGLIAVSDHDRADAELRQAEARIAEIRATIERKTIRAPFGGLLGIRQANLGQYLNSGDPIVSLQALDPIYVDFTVPQGAVGGLGAGREVRATADGAGALVGSITAVDSVVDAATRNVRVQASFDNGDGRLRPGMFVEVQVVQGAGQPVIAVPTSAISYAPYGDSVFVVSELEGPNGQKYRGVHQQFVKLGAGRGDQVAVVSGLEPGAEVVTSGVFKLRNGAAVYVDNQIQPSNNAAPEPEDS